MPRSQKPTPQQIAERTVVLEVERKKPGFRRKMKASDVVSDDDMVDRSLLHISKDLLDRKLLAAIRTLDSQMRAYLESRSVSCSMLARGMWLIPSALVTETDAAMSQYQKERAKLVTELVDEKYAPAKKEAEQRLGKHYDEADYPAPADLKAAFSVKVRWISYNVPAALEQVNKEVYERERQRVEAEWTLAGEEMKQALREAFAGLVEHMADRLGTDEEGKPKVFRDSTVKQMTDFLSTFAARDLTGDDQLAGLARQAQALLKGVAPEDLRKKDVARDRVLQGMQAIKDKLAKMDVTAPKARRFVKDAEAA